MPGRIGNMHRRTHKRIIPDEEEEEEESSSSDTSNSKRARFDPNASTQTGNRDHEELDEEAHQPGSIVRVKLTNFVTYTAAEFHPGPSLNMVIGPNGTGKSTLVCAICLGLGWSPKHLGRAKELGEFVKHGSERAEIEIELAAGKHHQRNPVIRRVIRKEGNKSVFYINDQQTTQNTVIELARSFAIQIDNLCQFLPQDRVVEFAKLDPVSLLRETQRAAAPEQMIVWHDELKRLRATEKHLELKQATGDGHLTDLRKKQAAEREDVERWTQRQALILKKRALETCRPIIEKSVLFNQVGTMKAEIRTAKQDLRQLEAEEAPAQQAQKDMAMYRDQIEQIVKNRKSHIDKAKRNADRIAESIKTGQGAVAEALVERDAETDAEKKRRQQLITIDREIADLENSQKIEPIRQDEGSNVRIGQLRSDSSRIERRKLELDEEMGSAQQRAKETLIAIKHKKGDRDRLNTQSGQQANLLAKLSHDAARGWKWIEDNRASLSLKGDVYGPPILECSVTDPRFADAVESQLRQFDLTAITCDNGEDAKLISNKLLGELRLHQVSIRTSPKPLSFYQSPVTREELAGYGLDGWIMDYLRGPEAVLAMLCDSAQIHRAAFASRQVSDQQHQALEHSPISIWIAGQEKFQITRRREYNAVSTRITTIKKAQLFIDQPVDAEQQRRLDDAIKELEHDLAEVTQTFQTRKSEMQTLRAEHDQVKNEMKEIQDDREKRQKAINTWRGLPDKIAQKQSEKENMVQLSASTAHRIRQIIDKAEKGSLEIARKTLENSKAITLLRQFHESLVEAEIRLVEATSEVESLERENRHIVERVAAKTAEIKGLEARKKDYTNRHNALVNKANDALRKATDNERAIVDEYRTLPSTEDLDNVIEGVSARLALMAEGNPNAVKLFERREQDIGMAEARLEEIRSALVAAKEQIVEIRGQWEPELDALVAKISDGFSHNFAGIGCAGQVGVYKDEDFDAWSIQIQVRFREHESLSILDSQRQSGGERAVSTIFYLMALQDLARSPFRVVDEINQGMDPRNERMVHERMVDIACRERTSQYFLITPKLLSNLKFHPKMKIHCIASGEHMPDQHTDLNFQNLANIALRIRGKQIAV